MARSPQNLPAAGPETPLASDENIGQRAAAAVGIASLVLLSLSLTAFERVIGSKVS
jgi:hypothetical protein